MSDPGTGVDATDSPPLEPLLEVVRILERQGIAVALGGSGLLSALGLAHRVRDWDLTTDLDLAAISAALESYRSQSFGPDGIHADHKVVIPDHGIEVICGFAFQTPHGVVRIPTALTGRWKGVPLGSPEAWGVAYALMGHAEKSELLLDHLARQGADRGIVDRLLREPLPDAIAERLKRLPQSVATSPPGSRPTSSNL